MVLCFTVQTYWILQHELLLWRVALFSVITQRVVVNEDGIDMLSRNVGKKLPLLAAE
jgi:hypothetical protein